MGECALKLYYEIFDSPVDKTTQRMNALRLLDLAVPNKPEIVLGEHGKPYFINSEIHFSYSHCEYGVACGIHTAPIGVDIQEIRAVRPQVLRRVCNDKEIESIKTDEDFIRIWTMKEAYAKFTGKGLAEGFKSIDTTGMSAVKVKNCYLSWYCEGSVDKVQLIRKNDKRRLEWSKK